MPSDLASRVEMVAVSYGAAVAPLAPSQLRVSVRTGLVPYFLRDLAQNGLQASAIGNGPCRMPAGGIADAQIFSVALP